MPGPAPRTPPRARLLARRAAVALGGLAATAVLVAGGIWLAIQGDGNVHVVGPGVIRSAQPSAPRLEDIVRRYGVRSVVNLRGDNAGTPWYDEEMAASRSLGLRHVDIALSARSELGPAQIDAVLAQVAGAPGPVLIHCNGGSDRTGLISAAWVFAHGGSPDAAGRQLALRYGHFPWLGSRTVAMDRSLAAFEARGPAAAASAAAATPR